MKKLVLLLVVLAVGGGGAYYYYAYGKPKEKPQIVQAAVSQGDVTEQVQATGTLDAIRTVQVGSQVSGTVSEIDADFNAIVKKDQVIAKLDPQLLQVQVDIAESNVERQNGQIASAQVNLENAQRQLQRTQGLFDRQLDTQQDLDAAVLAVKTDETNLESAKEQLTQDNASLNQAKLNVSYTIIKAPIDGVIVNRLVDIGQTVQSSMSVAQFFTIAMDLRDLKLTAGVDEADIGKIRPNMRVDFTVDSYPNTTFQGTVNSVRLNASTSNNVVTYPVWIDAPNPDLRLRPSMTATAQIIVSTAPNVIRIPNQALRFRPTADMYTALGLTPPPAGGRGRGAGGGGRGADANSTDAQPIPTPAAQTAANQPATPPTPPPSAGRATSGTTAPAAGQAANGANATGMQGMNGRKGGGQGQNGQGRGTGQNAQGGQGGRGGRNANLTPEERAARQAQFAGRGQGQNGQAAGGRGFGQGQMNMTQEQRQQMAAQFGGRGAGGGRNGGQPANVGVAPVELNADKIDDLYPPMQRQASAGTVYVWDGSKLTEQRLRVGITDGKFTELVSGDVKVGDQLVTSIVIPVSQQQRNQQNQSIFGGAQPGRGGLQPGGPGGPGGFGGGGGGGGGGRGGGR